MKVPITGKEWLLHLPGQLAGRVVRRLSVGHVHIQLLDGLLVPLDDGTMEDLFFSKNASPEFVPPDTYVLFEWDQPGRRGARDPIARNLVKVNRDEALATTEKTRRALQNSLTAEVQRLEDLLHQEEHRIQEAVAGAAAAARSEYDAALARLHVKEELLAAKESALAGQEEQVDTKLARLEQLRAELEPFRRFLPQTVAADDSSSQGSGEVPDRLAHLFPGMLASLDVRVPEYVAVSFLLSTVAAAYLGRLVLLNGPVGVGKSSIVQKAARVLDGVPHVTPVRPAWLDPTDLLGFFDPINRMFQPTPFLSALLSAPKESLYLMCLDELNLARIENYGADLLSGLEYTRASAGTGVKPHELELYSHSLFEDLMVEYKWLADRAGSLDLEKSIRLRRLEQHMNLYRSRVLVPETAVLVGTLNSDATTYELSPKVIDRSFVITFPMAQAAPAHTGPGGDERCRLTLPLLRSEIERRLAPTGSREQDLLRWNEELAKYGIPLSHRTVRDLQVFQATAQWLGLTEAEAFGYFVYTRVLPRIHFYKDDGQGKAFRFAEWFRDTVAPAIPFSPPEVTGLLDQAANTNQQYVRYWSDRA